MGMRIKPMAKTFLLSLIVSLFAAAVQAAVVHTKDGRRFEGTLVSATAREVQLHTPEGLLTIETNRISRIDYEGGATSQAPAAPAVPPAAQIPPAYTPYQRAISSEGKQSFSVNFGFIMPVSDLDFSDTLGGGKGSNGDIGFLIGLQYLMPVNSRLSIGPDFEFSGRGSSDSSGLLDGTTSRVSGKTFSAQMVAKYALTDHGGARPYISAGVGAHRTSTKVDSTPLDTFAWDNTPLPDSFETRRLVDDTAWGLASSFHFGVDIPFSETDVFGFEVGWTGLFGGKSDATFLGREQGLGRVGGELHNISLAARWGWRF